jgi:hypothetical protein
MERQVSVLLAADTHGLNLTLAVIEKTFSRKPGKRSSGLETPVTLEGIPDSFFVFH